MTEQTLQQRLLAHGQHHLWQHLQSLDEPHAEAFAAQVERVDWAELTRKKVPTGKESLSAPDVLALQDRAARSDATVPIGTAAYKAGEVAVLIVAGGQGSRLGFDGPKGCYPLVNEEGRKKTIFELLTDKIHVAQTQAGVPIPLLLMTSPHTHEPTVEFFRKHRNFGLSDAQVRFFSQATVPTLDDAGRALLADEYSLLTNPDGHGGCFEALVASGELARLVSEGRKWLVYLQVDNVLAKAWDPFAVGLAAQAEIDALTKVLKKRDPDEKVGHLVRRGTQDAIVEYTELNAEQVRAKAEDGQPLFRWGNTAMHVWRVGFLADLAHRNVHLELHRSKKAVLSWTPRGQDEVFAWKSERFIFDLLAYAAASVGLEVDRSLEFAPVKNAAGQDSPQTARDALAALAQ